MADDGAMSSFWEIEVPKSLACTTHAHAEYKNISESLRMEKWKHVQIHKVLMYSKRKHFSSVQ